MIKGLIIAMIFVSALGLASAQTSSETFTIIVGENASAMDTTSANSLASELESQGFNATVVEDMDYSDDGDSNVIAIGGSCVNAYSASLLNLPYPACGSLFTGITNVGEDQFMIRTASLTNDRIAVLIAGYEGQDTSNGVEYLLDQNISNVSSNMAYIRGSNSSINSSGTNSANNSETYDVDIQDFEFSPQSLTIQEGDTVIWTNEDNAPHNVRSRSGQELSSNTLQEGDTYSHTFDEAGNFSYYCSIHPNMTGTIIVESEDE